MSPEITPDFQKVVSLELQQQPPYQKWLTVANLRSGNRGLFVIHSSAGSAKQFPPLDDWFTFESNEAALQYNNGQGYYFTIMGHNLNDTTEYLIAIDVSTGDVKGTLETPPSAIWHMLYVYWKSFWNALSCNSTAPGTAFCLLCCCGWFQLESEENQKCIEVRSKGVPSGSAQA